MLAAVEKSRKDLVHVCAGADEEEDDQQQRLEVEESRLEGKKKGVSEGLEAGIGNADKGCSPLWEKCWHSVRG